MIKFFRKIRQKLVTENKFSKYLLYAIGEIILVVIGILIALSINNWNEDRKINLLELSLLIELQGNLRNDILDMKENIGIHENGLKSAHIILQSFNENLPTSDSINSHFAKVWLVPKYLPTKTSYKSIQKEGIRIIGNDSLKNSIAYYYETQTSFLISWNKSEWDVQFQDTRDVYRKYFKLFEIHGVHKPQNYNELRQSKEYKNYLNNRIGWIRPTIFLYEDHIQRAENLIKQIETELNNRDKD